METPSVVATLVTKEEIAASHEDSYMQEEQALLDDVADDKLAITESQWDEAEQKRQRKAEEDAEIEEQQMRVKHSPTPGIQRMTRQREAGGKPKTENLVKKKSLELPAPPNASPTAHQGVMKGVMNLELAAPSQLAETQSTHFATTQPMTGCSSKEFSQFGQQGSGFHPHQGLFGQLP